MRSTETKIIDRVSLGALLATWRLKDDVIVFTNGCFDLLHLGHVDYLEKARSLGNRMVLGLNSDVSVAAIKEEGRPIQDEKSRSRILASLQFVDAVVLFDEETPLELIEIVRPDILVKGKDYAEADIVGADFVKANGGRIETVELVEGYSTSAIVKKIRS